MTASLYLWLLIAKKGPTYTQPIYTPCKTCFVLRTPREPRGRNR